MLLLGSYYLSFQNLLFTYQRANVDFFFSGTHNLKDSPNLNILQLLL